MAAMVKMNLHRDKAKPLTKVLCAIAVLLLIVNTPMSLFQMHRLLAH